MSSMINESELPPPETLVQCRNGDQMALMFFYAPEEADAKVIANENGFDIRFISMLEGCEDAEDLATDYLDNGDGEKIIRAWQPPQVDGWLFAGKWDTEEGPYAAYLRKMKAD